MYGTIARDRAKDFPIIPFESSRKNIFPIQFLCKAIPKNGTRNIISQFAVTAMTLRTERLDVWGKSRSRDEARVL